MSSADNEIGNRETRNAARAGVLRIVLCLSLIAGATIMLAGCGSGGFQPMYAAPALGGTGVDAKLAQVDVAPIPGRVGQRIRNELIFQTTGGGPAVPPLYRLETVIKESVTSTLVRLDGEAGSNTYNLDVAFRLVRISDKAVVLEGASYGRAAYERFQSIFSNVRARQDAEDRASQAVGVELKTRLAAFLASSV